MSVDFPPVHHAQQEQFLVPFTLEPDSKFADSETQVTATPFEGLDLAEIPQVVHFLESQDGFSDFPQNFRCGNL